MDCYKIKKNLFFVILMVLSSQLWGQKDSFEYRLDTYHSTELEKTLYVSYYDPLKISFFAYIYNHKLDVVEDTLKNWKENLVYKKTDCKLVSTFNAKPPFFKRKEIASHFLFNNKKQELTCKAIHRRNSKGKYIWRFKKWHPNGQLAYKERSTVKRIYHYKRYNEKGRMIVKWRRDFTKGVNRLDGWATIWHEEEKRKLYKLYFEQDRVTHFVKYDHRDRVAFKVDYSMEEGKSMYDLLPKHRAELLYIENSCKSICFPQTPEHIEIEVYQKKSNK